MPRLIAHAPVGVVLLLIACSEPVAPTRDLDPAAPALSLAPSSSAVTRTSMPLHFIRSNECTGEAVEITGTINLYSRTKSNGGTIGYFNYSDARGIGLTSGTEYRVYAHDFVHIAGPLPASVQSVRTFRMVAPGPGNNLYVTALTLIKVSPSGEVSASIDRLSTRCR